MTSIVETFSMERIRRWGLRGGLAVADQGLFSGSNFLMNVLLARWLGVTVYGAFSLAFAVFLFFSGIYNAIILEPISVFGTAKYSGELKDYLAGQLSIHTIVCTILGVVVVAAGLVMQQFQQVDRTLSLAITGMGVFMPFMLLMWLARRSCYVKGKPAWAVCASTIYAVILLIALFYLYRLGPNFNIILIFAAMGIASLAGSAAAYAFMRFGSNPESRLPWRSLLTEQWMFGRWIVLASFLNFAGTQIQLFFSAALLGIGAAGVLSALQNFMLPMMQTVGAITTLGLPSVALEFGRQNYREMKRKSLRISWVLILLSVAYVLLLLVLARPIEHLFYGGQFASYTSLIPLLGIIPLLAAIESGFLLMVRSLRRPFYYAALTGLMALVGVISGWFFIAYWGVSGAILGLIAVALVSMIVNMWFYQMWFLPLAKQSS